MSDDESLKQYTSHLDLVRGDLLGFDHRLRVARWHPMSIEPLGFLPDDARAGEAFRIIHRGSFRVSTLSGLEAMTPDLLD